MIERKCPNLCQVMLGYNLIFSEGTQEGQEGQRFRGSSGVRISSPILIDFRQDVPKDKLDTDSPFPLKISFCVQSSAGNQLRISPLPPKAGLPGPLFI